MDLPTRLDFYALARDYLTSRNTKIDPAQVDIEGSNVNIFAGVSSVLADKVTRQLAYRTAALFLDGAEEEDLDRWAWDRYQQLRKGASAAIGTATISRTSVAAGAGSVPSGTVVATDTGVEYVTTTTATFGASTTSVNARVRAVQAGKATQVGAMAIKRFRAAGDLFDPTLTITNQAATAGGEDRESDPVFKDRLRKFWKSARRGTLGAIEYGALSVAGVVSAEAFEVINPDDSPGRFVQLYIADSSGVASDALADLVRTSLLEFRAGGIQVQVFTSLPQIVDIQLRLRFQANVDTLTLAEIVRAGVVSFVNSIPVNGPLYISQLYTTLQRYVDDGLIVDENTVVAPVGDLIPSVGQTIRTTMTHTTVL
jgi:hypothetical protein